MLKRKIHHIIFTTDTKAARLFDVLLLWSILISVLVVVFESVPTINFRLHKELYIVEWFFTILFTIEYIVRIVVSPKPYKYIFSVWGIVDLLSIIPTYLSLLVVGSHFLLVIRIFRLLRVFRVFKLVRFSSEASMLLDALKSSAYKISIFMLAVVSIVTLMGTVMYVIEGSENGFTSIPQGIYWAIITITTVGYGDVVPSTVMGKFISSFIMIIGYAIIAVPTGIVTVAMSKVKSNSSRCGQCKSENPPSSNYCNNCGDQLQKEPIATSD